MEVKLGLPPWRMNTDSDFWDQSAKMNNWTQDSESNRRMATLYTERNIFIYNHVPFDA
jgi:hypothetical protein